MVNASLQKSLLLQQFAVSTETRSLARVSSGSPVLDQLLPGQGFARGSLIEWLSESASGASLFALTAARAACENGGLLVVIDRDRTFYPPAAAAWRINLSQMLVVRPENDKDEYWALDQALRCSDIAAVLAWPRRLDHLTFRRLQLAAETSGSMGLLVRPHTARAERSWADIRFWVSVTNSTLRRKALPAWGLQVKLLRCRGRFRKSEIGLEICDRSGEIREAHACHLASKLACPEMDSRQVGA